MDELRILIPRPELHLVARFGPSIARGLDIHLVGARQRVARKSVPKGQLTILARLQLGHAKGVFGVSPSALNGHVVPVEQIWSAADVQSLYDELLTATSPADAATILERAIAVRPPPAKVQTGHSFLVREAAKKLLRANVGEVASDLGVSERHLRRVFLDMAGMSPKMFARVMRFSRATDLARENGRGSWASIAAAAGYYDQAHLIEDFHAFAGASPEVFRRELGNTGVLRPKGGAARSQ